MLRRMAAAACGTSAASLAAFASHALCDDAAGEGAAADAVAAGVPPPRDNPSQSVWLRHDAGAFAASTTTLPATADVVVVGAGLSGTAAAYHLACEHGLRVVLLDGRRVGGGATGRNGGILWDSPAVELAARGLPWREAWRRARLEARGRQHARALVAELGLGAVPADHDATLVRDVDAFELFETGEELREHVWGLPLGKLVWAFRGLWPFVAGVRALNGNDAVRSELRLPNPSPFAGALQLRKRVDLLWGAKLAEGLAREAAARGGACVAVGPAARVTRIDDSGAVAAAAAKQGDAGSDDGDGNKEGGDGTDGSSGGGGVVVHTAGGAAVRCHAVVHATNAWCAHLLPELGGKIVPVRNHVVSTAPLSALRRDAPDNKWSFARHDRPVALSARGGFVYAMQRADGRLLAGGFRDAESGGGRGVGVADDTGAGADAGGAAAAAAAWLPGTWEAYRCGAARDLETVEYAWTGILGWSSDDEPWVGPVPGRPAGSSFVCAGFSGHGMTRCLPAARAVAAWAARSVKASAQAASSSGSWRPDSDWWLDCWMPSPERLAAPTTADFYAGHATTGGGDGLTAEERRAAEEAAAEAAAKAAVAAAWAARRPTAAELGDMRLSQLEAELKTRGLPLDIEGLDPNDWTAAKKRKPALRQRLEAAVRPPAERPEGAAAADGTEDEVSLQDAWPVLRWANENLPAWWPWAVSGALVVAGLRARAANKARKAMHAMHAKKV